MTRLIRRKVKGHEIELATQEFLYAISYSFLGWPSYLNRWFYPDIYDWDWSEPDQNYVIPAWIQFFVNPLHHISHQAQINFDRHITANLGGLHYHYRWRLEEASVWAIHRPYSLPWIRADGVETTRWFSTIEWEQLPEEWRRHDDAQLWLGRFRPAKLNPESRNGHH